MLKSKQKQHHSISVERHLHRSETSFYLNGQDPAISRSQINFSEFTIIQTGHATVDSDLTITFVSRNINVQYQYLGNHDRRILTVFARISPVTPFQL